MIFGRCSEGNELWVPFIEKAYAKLMNGYDSLIGGFSQIGLRDLTGYCPEAIDISNDGSPTSLDGNNLLCFIKERLKYGSLMGVSAAGSGIYMSLLTREWRR